ncbi:MAG: hypothetical protein FD155_3376 [Bacteroidetes bacterium]|nr:MAG: hypothetical protein FD155_3376 [Bacteroidota bacterium]
MKTNKLKIITLVLFILTNFNLRAQNSSGNHKPSEISINEAIEREMLVLKITGAYDPRVFYEVVDKSGVHYGKCMAIILSSKIDSLILLRLDCGIQLIPVDTSIQTMIVTQKAIFPLYPNERYATRFYAMCGQLHFAAPNIETYFRIGELADSGLVKLANYLGDNYIQNMPGQHAMWAFTDEADFEQLKKYGADSISIAKSKEILTNLNLETKLTSGIVLPKVSETDEISINRYYIFSSAGLLLILITSTILLIFRVKRKANPAA